MCKPSKQECLLFLHTHKADQNGSEETEHSITGIILNALKFIMKGIIILLLFMTHILTCITVGSNTKTRRITTSFLLLFPS